MFEGFEPVFYRRLVSCLALAARVNLASPGTESAVVSPNNGGKDASMMKIGSRNTLNLSDLEAMPVGQNVIAKVKGHTVCGEISSPKLSRNHLSQSLPGEGGRVLRFDDGKPVKALVRITSFEVDPEASKPLPPKFQRVGSEVWLDARGLQCCGEVSTSGQPEEVT